MTDQEKPNEVTESIDRTSITSADIAAAKEAMKDVEVSEILNNAVSEQIEPTLTKLVKVTGKGSQYALLLLTVFLGDKLLANNAMAGEIESVGAPKQPTVTLMAKAENISSHEDYLKKFEITPELKEAATTNDITRDYVDVVKFKVMPILKDIKLLDERDQKKVEKIFVYLPAGSSMAAMTGESSFYVMGDIAKANAELNIYLVKIEELKMEPMDGWPKVASSDAKK